MVTMSLSTHFQTPKRFRPIACKGTLKPPTSAVKSPRGRPPRQVARGIFAVTVDLGNETACVYAIVSQDSLPALAREIDTLRDYGSAVRRVFQYALRVRDRRQLGVVTEQEARFDADSREHFRFRNAPDLRFFVRLHVRANGSGWSKMHVCTHQEWEKQRETEF